MVDGEQIARVHAAQRFADCAGNVLAGLLHAFAAVNLHVAVAQFQCLIFARRSAAGGDGRADHPAGKLHFRFDSRVSA